MCFCWGKSEIVLSPNKWPNNVLGRELSREEELLQECPFSAVIWCKRRPGRKREAACQARRGSSRCCSRFYRGMTKFRLTANAPLPPSLKPKSREEMRRCLKEEAERQRRREEEEEEEVGEREDVEAKLGWHGISPDSWAGRIPELDCKTDVEVLGREGDAAREKLMTSKTRKWKENAKYVTHIYWNFPLKSLILMCCWV